MGWDGAMRGVEGLTGTSELAESATTARAQATRARLAILPVRRASDVGSDEGIAPRGGRQGCMYYGCLADPSQR